MPVSTCLDLVLLVEDGFALAVIEPQGGVDLAASLDGLLIELVRAAGLAVEDGLETVAHMEEEIDGAAGFGIGGHALPIAIGLKVNHGYAGGKHAPVDGVGEGLLLREVETGTRRRKLGHLLAVSHGGQGKGTEDGCGVRARLQCRVWLLVA